ncbi:AbrB/MazE/SpoVT family DNA-binding domain-containing protein [Zavarzinella formosa]|uniref:AbrB/MazE/SpoVT family DNA-binding domain-containing protein n=1 Tax=Zavarzinella formosa TaxID=360055 RepID=UPI0002E2B8C3|nr:AbrB/MazE/SpoVT family DNA-binding domain-containing protein [Zavarzinella formosa]
MQIEHVKLGEDGRIVIPATLRRELGLHSGETLVVECDGESLLVRRHETVLRETQDYFRQFVTPGASIVDELIADRRDEAARDEAETEELLAHNLHG